MLIEAATRNIYRQNAFRVTGLTVDATPRDIAKHADKLKMMQELGEGATAHTGAFALTTPPTLDQIREAIQKLKDPELRLVDEFFWFWPREFGKSASDPALQALAKGDLQAAYDIWGTYEDDPTDGVVATHNKALTTQIIALDREERRIEGTVDEQQAEEIENYWRRSFTRWERLVVDDRLWDRVTVRARQIDDARLRDFVRRLRASLPIALDKINAELALIYAQAGKLEQARLHLQFMRETNRGLVNVENIAELVLTPVRTQLKEQIERAKRRAAQNPADGVAAATELLVEARRSSFLFDVFFGEGSHSQKEIFDEAANECVTYAVAHQRATGDNKTFVTLLQQALLIAQSVDIRRRIEENIAIGEGNLKFEVLKPVYDKLKAIQESQERSRAKLKRIQRELIPVLETLKAQHGATSQLVRQLSDSLAIVLREVSLNAWNKDEDKTTAGAANALALVHARDTELVNRLKTDQTTLSEICAIGDSRGEHQRMQRGSYDAMMYVVIAFVVQIVWSGAAVVGFVENVLGVPCPNGADFWVGAVAGTAFALLVFWDRWKCIEAYSSRSCSGTLQLSLLFVPVVALVYANVRGFLKVFKEKQGNRFQKTIRGALVVMTIVIILGAIGSSNSTKNTPSGSAATAPAPSSPSTYSPPPVTYSPPPTTYGNTYRVPSDMSAQLNRESEIIEGERAKLQSLEAQLKALGRDIDHQRSVLDNADEDAVAQFNGKVNRYNAMLEVVRSRERAFNQSVNDYNEKLRRDGR